MFYKRITEMLQVRGMSESCLAERIHKSRSYIRNCRLKDQTIPVGTMEEIASVLDVSVEYLMDTSNDKKEAPVKLTRRTKKLIKIYDALPADKRALLDTLLEQFARDEGIDSANDD